MMILILLHHNLHTSSIKDCSTAAYSEQLGAASTGRRSCVLEGVESEMSIVTKMQSTNQQQVKHQGSNTIGA
jgi:hypothetical protein